MSPATEAPHQPPSPVPAPRASQAAPQPTRVSFHVEELVLLGFRPAARYAIADAFQSALETLLKDPRVADQLARNPGIDQLRLQDLHLPEGSNPVTIGRALATALHARLLAP